MSSEILTVEQMYAADRYAAAHGIASLALMEHAGKAVADAVAQRWTPRPTVVLCGPGNNGGDGFVIARLLQEQGWPVRVALLAKAEALKGDAAQMYRRWRGATEALSVASLDGAALVIDGVFGAGLTRPLDGEARAVVAALNDSDIPVAAIDVPSGLHGDTGKPLDDLCLHADLTITFFRKKPAHVLMPGRICCGEILVAEIGIPTAALDAIAPQVFENGPALWGAVYPWPKPLAHKYARGHAVVLSGPGHATGAARLAARAALRVGAGLVSVASPLDAVAVNASALTAIMIKPFADAAALSALLQDKRLNAVVAGPGLGGGTATKDLIAAVLASKASAVLDADALTAFKDEPSALFAQLRHTVVLTPHDGEFDRLFGTLRAEASSKIEAVRTAAKRAGCTVLLKGPDTVIADPDGRVTVNTDAPPQLATAGSGDVLSGLVCGLLAQGMAPHQAASAAVWLHGKAAAHFGLGLIAEDLADQLPPVLAALKESLA